MKKRKGFISIIALIVVTVSFILVFDMIYINRQQGQMMNSRANNIQSYYLSEGKILMSLYEDKYYNHQLYPDLLDVFRKHNFASKSKQVIIDKSDLEDEDSISDVKLNFQDVENRKELVIKAQSDYKGFKSSVKSRATLVNELFELKESILAMDIIEEKYKYDLENLLFNIEENIKIRDIDKSELLYTSEISNFNKITLKKMDKFTYKVICTRDAMGYPYVESFDKREVFIVIRNSGDNKLTFLIDTSEISSSLSGIIYVEGDLEISGEFTFNGIIIVKEGKIRINSEVKPKVNGMMILYDDENIAIVNDEINLQYYNFTVYKYGSFIPGFLDINLKSTKNGE